MTWLNYIVKIDNWQLAPISKLAQDDALAAELWVRSEDLVQLKDDEKHVWIIKCIIVLFAAIIE